MRLAEGKVKTKVISNNNVKPIKPPPSGSPEEKKIRNYADRIHIIRKQDGGVRIVFGAHHYINITKEDEKLFCEIGCTHHGIKFESTDVNSELEKVIDRLRVEFPENMTD